MVDGKASSFDVSNLLTEEERRAAGNYGAQVPLGLQRLKERYGVDWSSLPEQEIDYGRLAQDLFKKTGVPGAPGYADVTTGTTDPQAFFQGPGFSVAPPGFSESSPQAQALTFAQHQAALAKNQPVITPKSIQGGLAGQTAALQSGYSGGGGFTPDTSGSDAIFKQYLGTLSPTSEETDLRGQQTALDTQLRNLNLGQGVMNANIEDQPIALPFITGQQSAIEKRYALQRGDVASQQLTVQQKLANELAKRQSSIDVSKAQLEYQTAKEKAAREGGFSLSPGEQRYDAAGS